MTALMVAAGPVSAEDVVPPAAAPTVPAWLHAPATLPVGWGVASAAGDAVTLKGPDATLVVTLSDSGISSAEALPTCHALLAGKWGKASCLSDTGSAGGAEPWRAVRPGPSGKTLSASIKAASSGIVLATAFEILADLRLADERIAGPRAGLTLEDRPNARINPVGLFVRLPKGWKPKLNKRAGTFGLRSKAGRVRLSKASSGDLRKLRSAGSVADAYPEYLAEALPRFAPGSYRAWRLLKVEGGRITGARELHLIRFKKLDDWSYHLVEIDPKKPEEGMAPFHDILATLGIIP